MTTASLKQELQEKAIAGQSAGFEQVRQIPNGFLTFLDYVYIMVPPPGGGRIKFQKWPHLLELAASFIANRFTVVLKPRQIGFSWTAAAYAVWVARFQPGAVILFLSKGEYEAKVLLKKARDIWVNMPKEWQLSFGTDSQTEITVPSIGSKMIALAATEDAGRGETTTLVVQDEAEFHEFAESNYAAVKPTLDSNGGQMILGSTVNKKKAVSLFKRVFQEAPENHWHPIFILWDARPGRDEEWYEYTQDNVPDLAEMSPELYMAANYPRSIAEALAPAQASAAFDLEVLKVMEEDCRRPKMITGPIKVFQGYRVGRKYMAATDTSHGTGYDFSCSVVMDAQTGTVVADIMDKMLDPEKLAMETMRMLGMYQQPVWAIEDNDWGRETLKVARDGKYPKIYHRLTGKKEKKPGWRTDAGTRVLLWGELIQAVNAGQIGIPNMAGLQQFYKVIRREDKGGRIEAMVGAHDDYPMAVGMAWQMRKHALSSGTKISVNPV